MDVRIFKLIILVAAEILLYIIYLVEPKISQFIPFFYTIREAHRLVMLAVPILILLPEENWIWLVEENPRGRKIALRSKASKHLHLSMLYILLLTLPIFILCVAILIETHFPAYYIYTYELTGASAIAAIVYGCMCAWKNYRNLKRYESLFAVGWDRKSSFLEIFVGLKVSKKPFFFYSGFFLIAGILIFAMGLLGPAIYFKEVQAPDVVYDVERYLILCTLYNFMMMISFWGVSMYVFFQIFFSRAVEHWSRQPRNKQESDEGD